MYTNYVSGHGDGIATDADMQERGSSTADATCCLSSL